MTERKISNCNRGCGADIYFDGNNPEGKTPSGGWVPIDVKTNRKHNCPNYNAGAGDSKPKSKLTDEQKLELFPSMEKLLQDLPLFLNELIEFKADVKRITGDSFKQASTMLDDDNGEVNLP
jgi:hypothetical protein